MDDGYFVLLLDILGFKRLVSTMPLSNICKLIEDTLLDECENWTGRGPNCDFDTIHFSDTVLLHSRKPGHYKEWYDDLVFIGSRICCRLLAQKIPVRGALSYGSFFTKKSGRHSVFLGQGLIDAHEREQSANHLGFAVDERIWRRFLPAPTAPQSLLEEGDGLVLADGSLWINPLSEFADRNKSRVMSQVEYDFDHPDDGSGYLPSELGALDFIVREATKARASSRALDRVGQKYLATDDYLKKLLGADLYELANELLKRIQTGA